MKLSTKKACFYEKIFAKPCKQKVVHKERLKVIHSFFVLRVDNPYLSTKIAQNRANG